ncbi:hypothetical protein [Hahella ganghwensis]|uniref:hypothetical protein n=1 Tax=Hahella ganghwensis TaxID=286420 RepID=UPI0003678E1C|nr:hypothetical protein [Hahella ganghwensis]
MAKGYYRHDGRSPKVDSQTKFWISFGSGLGNCFVVSGTRTGIIEWLESRKHWDILTQYEDEKIYLTLSKHSKSGGVIYLQEVGGAVLGGGTGIIRGSLAAVSKVSESVQNVASQGHLGFRVAQHIATHGPSGTLPSSSKGFHSLERVLDKSGWRSKYNLRITVQGSSSGMAFHTLKSNRSTLMDVWKVAKSGSIWS